MNILPAAFEERMRKQLPGEAKAFFQALDTTPPVSIRLNPDKLYAVNDILQEFSITQQVDWCDKAYYLNQRPIFTLDPRLHGGAYYVQEASSMFLHHILKQLMPAGPIRFLDLCAAPGGKSTLIASLLSPNSLLISNEVIRSRASILKENLIKWGKANIVITNNDPADFQPLEGVFDLILVDAPCSGEGMFRKDPEAIQEWSENNIRLCSERQQRILSDIWNCLKPGGMLIYSTCTYNPQENEAILEWLAREYSAQSIPISHTFNNITPGDSKLYCYHFYPHKTNGEGFFIGVVQKQDGHEYSPRKNKKTNTTPKMSLPEAVTPLIKHPELYAVYNNDKILGVIPGQYKDFILQLENTLNIIYKGCEVVEMNYKKIKLLPPLALNQILNLQNCPVYEADKTTAQTYLKKEDIIIPDIVSDWILISYQHIGLGWCKNLGNRLNNYYPKEWRIRMQIDSNAENNERNINEISTI